MMTTLRRFGSSEHGNFAVFSALASVPLVLSLGAAVDLSSLYSANRTVAESLDVAILAAAKAAPGQEAATAQMFFNANMGSAASRYKLAISVSNNAVKGNVSGQYSTSFLKLASLDNFEVAATATAELPRITSISFTPTNASGWYPKTIFVYTKDKDGNFLMRQDVITYDYKITTGKKTIVPSLATATKVYQLGSTYDTFGVGMIVWDQFEDKRMGSTKTYFSDAVDAGKRLRSEGNCRPNQVNHWEDGGDDNYKDFEYNLTCNVSNAKLRISK